MIEETTKPMTSNTLFIAQNPFRYWI